jgi:uncharacterized peroxidase-related enzyme
MPNLATVEASNASPEVQEIYADFQRKMGFPSAPNFIKTQGHSAAVAKGTWGLVENVLVRGSLPRTLKEMLFSAISRERQCRYCEAAHLACCRMLGVDSDTLEQLTRDITGIQPAKVRDMILFGMKCARDPRALTSEDFALLRMHGLRESEITELVAMSGLAVYANIMADATGMEADKMFGQF